MATQVRVLAAVGALVLLSGCGGPAAHGASAPTVTATSSTAAATVTTRAVAALSGTTAVPGTAVSCNSTLASIVGPLQNEVVSAEETAASTMQRAYADNGPLSPLDRQTLASAEQQYRDNKTGWLSLSAICQKTDPSRALSCLRIGVQAVVEGARQNIAEAVAFYDTQEQRSVLGGSDVVALTGRSNATNYADAVAATASQVLGTLARCGL